MNHPAARPTHRLAAALAVAAVVAGPATTALATTDPTTHPAEGGSPPLAVNYQDPPPDLLLYPFAHFTLPEGDVESWELGVAVTADGGAIVVDGSASEAYTVDNNGAVFAPVALDAVPSFTVAGPEGILYGLTFNDETQELRMSAIPMTGDAAGTVVGSSPVIDRAMYLELPIAVFGNSDLGIVDRARDVGTVLLPHVGASGQPARYAGFPGLLKRDGETVYSLEDPNTVWSISVQSHPYYSPGAASAGDSPPVWIDAGTAAYWTNIGPPVDPEVPESGPTLPVIAFLNADGSGAWYSIPDDWKVASADAAGLVFIRQLDGGVVQLAHIVGDDDPAPVELADDPCPDYTPNADEYPLQLCDEGDGVRAVQTGLVGTGLPLVVDGFFGPNTQAAVRQFQRDAGLEIDGLAGPNTWAALQEAFPQEGSDADGSGVVDPWEVVLPDG
ncbi:hypothetical protein BH24ACT5_BH24ACT5_13310 [soil metagenome]